MRSLLLRILLATSVSCAGVWLFYEQVWLQIQYDLDSEKLAESLAGQGTALIAQFDVMDPADWQQAVGNYNRKNETLLALLDKSDPDWPILIAEIGDSEGGRIHIDAYESIASMLLRDEQTILQLEQFYFEVEGLFDVPFWLFLMLGIVIGYPLLSLVLGPLETRLAAIVRTAGKFIETGQRTPLPIGGHGTIAELEQGLNDLTAHLDIAVSDLQQSISNQRDLLHAVAHEFRSPIARLRFAQDMLEECDTEPERQELLAGMDQSIEELDGLVSEVLGYSRIRHGGYRLDYASVDLAAMANTVINKVRILYPAIVFEYQGDTDATLVQVDQRMLERATVNLVRNAARFASSKVEVSSSLDERFFVLRVADDGPGIPPGRRERVFEPFTRLDDSRSRDSGGIGLGLAIVHAISSQHQGQVRLHDSELGGAEFELHWPRSKPSA